MSSTAPRGFIGFQARSLDRAVVLKVVFMAQLTVIKTEIERLVVGEAGFEPARPKPHAPKACASTIPPLPRNLNGTSHPSGFRLSPE